MRVRRPAECDLVQDPLGDEMAPGILREVRGTRTRHLPRIRLEQADRDLRERRLPRAIRPGERDHLAAPHLERRALEHDTVAVGEANIAHAADELGRVRQVERTVGGQPREGVAPRRVEDDPACLHEQHAVDVRQRPCGRCSETRTAHGSSSTRSKNASAASGSSCDVGSSRSRSFGRSASARQATPAAARLRKLPGDALGEVLGADERQRLLDPRPDLVRLDAEVLEPEGRFVRNLAHHDPVLRSWNTEATVPASSAGRAVRVSMPPTTTLPANVPP